ncbi:MAG: M24 family metallopeptidase [Rickettsiales bacterium]
MTNLKLLLNLLKNSNYDGYLINTSDEFLDEFVPEKLQRLKWLTGFSGSNGLALISLKIKVFFTDGRYVTQAKQELAADFKIYNIAEMQPEKWLVNNLPANFNLAYDAKSFSATTIIKIKKYLKKDNFKLTIEKQNYIDLIWQRPKSKITQAEIIADNLAGANSESKIKNLKFLQQLKAKEAYFTADSAAINWLLNIRGKDTKFTPLLHCYFLYYHKNNFIYLDLAKISAALKTYLFKLNITILPLKQAEKIAELCKKYQIKTVKLDINYVSYYFYSEFKANNIAIESIIDPLILAKACKNKTEIKHCKKSHILDAIAKTKFLFWLDQPQSKLELDEISASHKLLEFRKQHKEFLFSSFNTISAFAENGAIIHYNANQKTNKKFTDANLYLVDSGGQYKFATTDITRTIAYQKQATKEQKENYTLVLKGHIALAMAKFPQNTKGFQLDILARQFLWQYNKDYAHGTGHGVGCFLNVHEGPHSISKAPINHNLQENMLVTNEPGFYLENHYGIRIENILLIKKNKENMLYFETLTLVPMDENLIALKLLTKSEKLWLKNYHQKIYNKIGTKLSPKEAKWLKNKIAFYN